MFLKNIITKYTILTKVSEEELFERYLGVPVRFDTSYTNPFRADRSPGCTFWCSETTGILYFVDWANSAKRYWDWIDVASHYYNDLSYPLVIEQVAKDFGLVNGETYIPNRAIVQLERPVRRLSTDYTPIAVKLKGKWSDWELDFWQFSDMEVTTSMLEKARIYTITDYWMNGWHSGKNLNKTFAYHLGGYDKFQIYRPAARNRNYRFRQSSSEWIIGVSELRQNEPIILTKSMKDMNVLRWMGFNVVTTLSETKIVTNEEIEKLRQFDPRIVILYDIDPPGLESAQQIAIKHNCQYITYPKEWKTKDTYDSCKQYGTKQVKEFLQETLENLIVF